MENEIYIRKKAEPAVETDFQQLQRSALESLQRLSGNLWTDFNEHDPGITIMDALNYALTELDYKCSFPLEDYLNSPDNNYIPEQFGLFRPDQVYPSNPVTEKDYCKLIFDRIEKIAGLWMVDPPNSLPGVFDIVIDLIPTATNDDKDEVEQKVAAMYHQTRNLCENLNKIYFRDKKRMELTGEIELDEESNASEILAHVYFLCARYFNPGIKYIDLRAQLNDEPNWPNWFDGPLLQNGIIDNNSVLPVKTSFFISDLYDLIRKIKGVRIVKKLSLIHDNVYYSDEIHCDNIFNSCTVRFPSRRSDVQLLLIKSNQEARFDFDDVTRWYKKMIIEEYGHQNQYAGLKDKFTFPKGSFNNFAEYSSVQNDFPNFYGINENGVPDFFDEQRKAQAKQLKAYLLGFDMTLANSMQELGSLNQLLNIDAPLPHADFPDLSKTVSHWDELIDHQKLYSEQKSVVDYQLEARNALFDLLDSFYGEKSALPFSDEFDIYQSTIATTVDKINHRALFIRNEPSLIPQRSCAIDLTTDDPDNLPGLKKWFSLVMGLPAACEMPVTNVFSRFSLRLLSDKEFYDDLKGLLNIDFVINDLDDNFKNEEVFDVPNEPVPDPIENYNQFKNKIYLLNHNIVFESFLRNGIHLANYKIVQHGKGLFLLAYHSEEQAEWIGLGRFDRKEEAVEAANQLKELLIYLNRYSENLYLVEHLLLFNKKAESGYTIHISDDGKPVFNLLKPVSRSEVYQLSNNLGDVIDMERSSIHRSIDGRFVIQFKAINGNIVRASKVFGTEKEAADFLLANKNENILLRTEKFGIRQTENDDYVILSEYGEGNAVYCQQTFATEEEASDFFQHKLKEQLFNVEFFYQLTDNLLLPADFMDFGMTVVLPSWSARFHNTKFQGWCEELIEERCPAHVKLHFLWLTAPAIRQFEKLYFAWRSALATGITLYEKSVDLASFLNNHLHRKHGKNN